MNEANDVLSRPSLALGLALGLVLAFLQAFHPQHPVSLALG
jgi:hypothetical protein